MSYLPFCGGWFYGAPNAADRASYYCSWGLIDNAPAPYVPPTGLLRSFFRKLRIGR